MVDILFYGSFTVLFVCGILHMVKKFYPCKTWRQIIFPMLNTEPESIHEIEYFRTLDFSEVPDEYLNKVKYQLLKLSRVNNLEFPDKKVLVNTENYAKPFYIESDNNTVTILVKK